MHRRGRRFSGIGSECLASGSRGAKSADDASLEQMRGLLILLCAVAMAQIPSTKPRAATTRNARANTMQSAPMTDDQKTIYALGLSIYDSLAPFDLSPEELTILKRALSDAAAGKPAISLSEWQRKIQSLAQERAPRVLEREKTASRTYIEKAATEPGAIKTESGLVYREVRPGSGPMPKATDTVSVNYRGTLINGTEFDSSNAPVQFALNRVIPCWTEGLQKMKVGGKAVLVCPSDLAYGDGGRPSIPGGAALVFDIELLGINGSTQ